MAAPSSTQRGIDDPEELWEAIKTDMAALTTIYQEHASSFVQGMSPERCGLRALDMEDLEKPPSVGQCIQRMMTAFDPEPLQKCFDDAFDALDYNITDNLCKASRTLRVHF